MSKQDKPRKYDPLWKVIKDTNIAFIAVEGAHTMTSAQREKVCCTIRKAIIKCKDEDGHFKRTNPKLRLDITFLEDYRSICFKLIERIDPLTDF